GQQGRCLAETEFGTRRSLQLHLWRPIWCRVGLGVTNDAADVDGCGPASTGARRAWPLTAARSACSLSRDTQETGQRFARHGRTDPGGGMHRCAATGCCPPLACNNAVNWFLCGQSLYVIPSGVLT